MSLKKYSGDAWNDVDALKRYDTITSAWVDCEYANKYNTDSSAWEEVWSNGLSCNLDKEKSSIPTGAGYQVTVSDSNTSLSVYIHTSNLGDSSAVFYIDGDFGNEIDFELDLRAFGSSGTFVFRLYAEVSSGYKDLINSITAPMDNVEHFSNKVTLSENVNRVSFYMFVLNGYYSNTLVKNMKINGKKVIFEEVNL